MKTGTHVSLVVFLAAGALLALIPSASALTEDQVIERARKFLQDVGREIPADEPEATRLTGDREPGSWKVYFGYKVEVEVSDSSSKILAFSDLEAIGRSKRAERPISPEDAKRKAAQYVEAAGGFPEGAVFDAVSRIHAALATGEEPLRPVREHPAAWFLVWRRFMGTYRVLPDALAVDVNAATGRLEGLRNGFIIPKPDSMEPVVTRDQAEAIARRAAPEIAEAPLQRAYVYIQALGYGVGVKTFQRTALPAWHLDWPGVYVRVNGATAEVPEVVRYGPRRD